MKRKLFFVAIAALGLLAVSSCSREKTCRCAVLHSSLVRIIKIDKGSCEDIKLFRYHTPLDSLMTDSLICTDYEFRIDSIYNK